MKRETGDEKGEGRRAEKRDSAYGGFPREQK